MLKPKNAIQQGDTHIKTLARARAHAHTHTCTYTHARTRTHARKHAHASAPNWLNSPGECMDIVDGKKRLWYCANDVMVAGVAVRANSVTPALLRSLPYDVMGPKADPGGRLGASRRLLSSAKSTRLSMTLARPRSARVQQGSSSYSGWTIGESIRGQELRRRLTDAGIHGMRHAGHWRLGSRLLDRREDS